MTEKNITNKKYIRNLIIKALEGQKIDKQESQELEKVVLNFNQAEWRNFKIIGKEAIKEWVDKKIDETTEIPSNWRGEVKNFLHSLINLALELASEELIVESVRLEREKMPWEQRIRILVPLYTKQLEKIAARKPAKQISNYHKAEVGLVKKVKQLRSMFMMAKMIERKPTKKETMGAVNKVINIFKNLSPEEIAVAKEKGKSLGNEYLNRYTPAEFRQYPELKSLAKSVINFCDALLDEKLLAEAIKLASEALQLSLKHLDFEQLKNAKNVWERMSYGMSLGEEIGQTLQKSGLENQARQLLVNLTNHINQLASEEAKNNNISATEEQSIEQKLSTSRQLSSTNNSTTKSGTGLNFLSPASTLGSIEAENGDNSNLPSEKEFWEIALKEFTTVKSKEKWYKNPWFIGFSIVGAFAVGGLIVWFLTRRKKERIVDRESNF